MTELKITQADVDSASAYWGNDNPPIELRQAFARHRIAAEEGQAELVREIAAQMWFGTHCWRWILAARLRNYFPFPLDRTRGVIYRFVHGD